VGIVYLDGSRLRRSLIAAADWVETGREELNRINIFPVPDSDTGTNIALTLRAVAKALIPQVLQHLERCLTPRLRQLRIGIAHADAADIAATVCDEIQKRFHPRECLVVDVTATLGVHVGPRTWAVFYQIEEQGDAPRNNYSSEGL